jgi:ribosomal protein S18 acetylase RimI-like enzyme
MTEIQALQPGHRGALSAFFAAVPEGDRTFFRDRVLDDGTIEAWLAEPYARRLVAVDDSDVLGVASLVPGTAWSAHVGGLEVVVDPACRRRGIGRLLVQESIRQGVPGGIDKFTVQVLADHEAALSMFQALGFESEAILRAHVRDNGGESHDLVVLAHFVDDNLAAFDLTGIAEAVRH